MSYKDIITIELNKRGGKPLSSFMKLFGDKILKEDILYFKYQLL